MKKILFIILIFLTGCSKYTLNCSKYNYSTIYGKEIIIEKYYFKNNKLFNYINSKEILFDNDMIKYIDNIFKYYEIESNIIKENVKGSNTEVKKDNDTITAIINIDINYSDNSLEKINIKKNSSIDYLKKNLTEKGYSCSIEN